MGAVLCLFGKMDYTQKVLEHPLFIKIQNEISQLEDGRIYCHHELAHALDVCRIAWILYLEAFSVWYGEDVSLERTVAKATDCCRPKNGLLTSEKRWEQSESAFLGGKPADKEKPERLYQIRDRMYVAGLLHDIGRAAQYTTGVHHSIAGILPAKQILEDIGYPEEWKAETLAIVGEHYGREEKELDPNGIAYYIDRADHLSRNCFACAASDTCKWKEEEKNQKLLC